MESRNQKRANTSFFDSSQIRLTSTKTGAKREHQVTCVTHCPAFIAISITRLRCSELLKDVKINIMLASLGESVLILSLRATVKKKIRFFKSGRIANACRMKFTSQIHHH